MLNRLLEIQSHITEILISPRQFQKRLKMIFVISTLTTYLNDCRISVAFSPGKRSHTEQKSVSNTLIVGWYLLCLLFQFNVKEVDQPQKH